MTAVTGPRSGAPERAKDLFGFLPYDRPIEFEGGSLMPLAAFEDAAKWVESRRHKDGFVYPELQTTYRGSRRPGMPGSSVKGSDWEPEPHTERPALLHKLPASHEILLHEEPREGDLRANDGGFLMHLASYLFGVRLQFHDWWFDGRIPIRSTHNVSTPPLSVCAFFSQAFQTWRGWRPEVCRRFTNILYMNSRAPSYEWDWERFMINYMVFDALYRVDRDLRGAPEVSHSARLRTMCSLFGLAIDQDHLKDICDLRNDLFHEALWDGSQPGTSRGTRAYYEEGNLRRLNQRLIPAILGYGTDYIASSWWSLSCFDFSEAKSEANRRDSESNDCNGVVDG